jgi:hypothetical protein
MQSDVDAGALRPGLHGADAGAEADAPEAPDAVADVFAQAPLHLLMLSFLHAGEELASCSLVSKAWRERSVQAACAWLRANAPALAAALADAELQPAAWLAAAKRCNDGRSGAGATLPSARAAMRDYSLLIDVRTPSGEAVFGSCLPLSQDWRGCVEAVGAAAAPVRAASMPPVATDVPSVLLAGLPHTGARDVRDLRCSVAFVRQSTAEIARCWRDATPVSNALMRYLCASVPPGAAAGGSIAGGRDIMHAAAWGRLPIQREHEHRSKGGDHDA